MISKEEWQRIQAEDQRHDEEERQRDILEALWEVAGAGLTEEAETLAEEAGVGSIWKQQLRARHG